MPSLLLYRVGFRLLIDGQIVGGVGVSGAASAQQDEDLALRRRQMCLPRRRRYNLRMSQMSKAPKVLFFDATQVNTSFSAGRAFDGTDLNYMVHTSRRDKPGLAEVHTLDTDIIYVLEGNATFVTGGTVTDAKETAPHEFRGSRIDGGTRGS